MTEKRRGRGDGSLFEVRPGVWRLRVYIGRDPVTRKPLQASRMFKGKKSGALQALRELAKEVDDGQHKATKTTSVAYLLDECERLVWPALRQTTREDYARVKRKHLAPALGQLELRRIGVHDIDRYYQAKLEEGLTGKTIRLHKAILGGALDRAVDWGWIPVNPVASSHPPRIVRVKKSTPAVDQVRALIALADDDWELAMAVVIAAITGARRGELCGLQWPDVDWEAGVVTFRRQRVPVEGGDITGPLKYGEERPVPLGPLGLAMLRRYEDLVRGRAANLGVEARWDGWLISRDCGRSPMNARGLGSAISELGARAGMEVTPHAFRRFAATQLLGGGHDVMVSAARLGHTPAVMLREYASALPAQAFAAAAGLEALVLPGGREEAPVEAGAVSEHMSRNEGNSTGRV